MFFSWRRAEIGDLEIEPSLDLPVGLLGETDPSGLGDALPSRAAILTPSPIRSPSLSSTTSPRWMPIRNSMRLSCGDPGVALDHRPLDFDGAAHRVDDAAELDDCAVAGALDDAAVVNGDGRVDQVAAKRPQPRQNPVLVGSGKPRIADDVGHQDRRELSGLAHGANAEA